MKASPVADLTVPKGSGCSPRSSLALPNELKGI